MEGPRHTGAGGRGEGSRFGSQPQPRERCLDRWTVCPGSGRAAGAGHDGGDPPQEVGQVGGHGAGLVAVKLGRVLGLVLEHEQGVLPQQIHLQADRGGRSAAWGAHGRAPRKISAALAARPPHVTHPLTDGNPKPTRAAGRTRANKSRRLDRQTLGLRAPLRAHTATPRASHLAAKRGARACSGPGQLSHPQGNSRTSAHRSALPRAPSDQSPLTVFRAMS